MLFFIHENEYSTSRIVRCHDYQIFYAVLIASVYSTDYNDWVSFQNMYDRHSEYKRIDELKTYKYLEVLKHGPTSNY